jgi:uncharacterized membrane protein YfcA
LTEIVYLVIAGIIGGAINSIAGGGSLITFPALVFFGLNPLVANATNTFASMFSYFFGGVALRNEYKNLKKSLFKLGLLSLIGGYIGAEALLYFSNDGFIIVLPYLLLFSTLLFAFGEKINNKVSLFNGKYLKALSLLIGLIVCIYGGFFNAGFGILIMAYLVLFNKFTIEQINALKLFVSLIVSIFAVLRFGYDGVLALKEGIIVGIGAGIGGYTGGIISKRVSQKVVKILVIIIGISLSIYYF